MEILSSGFYFIIRPWFLIYSHGVHILVKNKIDEPIKSLTVILFVCLKDPFEVNVKKRATGTFSDPTLIPSMYEKRLIGCICESGSNITLVKLQSVACVYRSLIHLKKEAGTVRNLLCCVFLFFSMISSAGYLLKTENKYNCIFRQLCQKLLFYGNLHSKQVLNFVNI